MRLEFKNILDCENGLRQKVREWRNLPEIRKYMYTDRIIGEDEHAAWLEGLGKNDKNRFFIVFFDSFPIGAVSLNNINHDFKTAEWAFYIFDEGAKNKGIGAAIEAYFLDYVFEECGFEKLNCEVISSNEAVVKMHQKFGFEIEGVRRKNIVKNGTREDVVLLGILKEEWLCNRDKLTKVISRIVS